MSQIGQPAQGVAAAASAHESGARALPVWAWIALWMAFWVGVPLLANLALRGVVNGWQLALAVFLGINLLICLWEISLWRRIDDIRRWFHMPRGTGDRPRGNLYTTRVTPAGFFSTRLWARTWLGYAHFDDGYADPKSFGFSIDVGNGFSTLVPSLLFHAGMSFPILPPMVLGLIGLLIFYQKLYCTGLYFFQYLYNRRYAGRPLGAVLGIVGGTNGIWLVFPAIGIYVCLRLIFDGSFDVIWS